MIKDIADFIRVYKNLAPLDWCDGIVNRYRGHYGFSHAKCGADSGYHPEVRDCHILEMSQKDVEWHDPLVDRQIFEVVSGAVSRYITEFPMLSTFVNMDEGYWMLRYKEGEKVANHIDVGSANHRVLSCSVQLNDDFEGGKWKFWGKELGELKKGDVVVFPSNFCFEHEVSPVESGERYSFLTFVGAARG